MFDKKYEPVLISCIMSLFISAIMSFAISFMNLGFRDDFLYIWFHAYWRSFVLAFPITFLSMPFVKKIVAKMIKN